MYYPNGSQIYFNTETLYEQISIFSDHPNYNKISIEAKLFLKYLNKKIKTNKNQ